MRAPRNLWPRDPDPIDLPLLFLKDPRRGEWFLSNVAEVGECLEWQGARRKAGPGQLSYGTVNIGGRTRATHRVAYALHYGMDPGSYLVCHRCDNPPCVRKEHLFLGTARDNNLDALVKGRANTPRGSRKGQAKLDEDKVAQMRRLKRQGWGYKRLARAFRVSTMTAKFAVTGVTWAHVEEPPA